MTGGTGALGRAVVRRLALAGARVHVTWRSEREAAAFRDFLGPHQAGVVLHRTDVTSADEVTKLFAAVQADPGRLDILACLVGGFTMAPVQQTTPEAWERMIAINATSAFLCCRAAVPLLRASGRGRIVTVAARPAVEHGAANMTAYAASKAALLTLTYSLAKELVKDRITVNAIVPSIIDTADNRAAMPQADTSGWVKPDEIADLVAFLVGDGAAAVTGSAVNLSRG